MDEGKTKKCSKCGEQPREVGSYCRECRNAKQRDWVERHYEQHRAACNAWKNANKKRFSNAVMRWMKDVAHRKQVRAMWRVRRAVKDGRLVPAAKCEICGKKCKTQAHHQDYDKPLEVNWVCRKHQIFIHNCVRELQRIASR